MTDDKHDEADKLGRKQYPELIELMDIRNTLMKTMEQNPDYKHGGSGAGAGGADFNFSLKGKSYWVSVCNHQREIKHTEAIFQAKDEELN